MLFRSNKVRTDLGLTNKFVIGHVGAFREQKNHKFLLDIFSKLNIPNAELMLMGDGDLKTEMVQRAKSLGISNRVLFMGSRNDVADLLQACDVFVMPSLWEGLGIAAIEAQASGLPTLVSNNFPQETQVTNLCKFLSLNTSEEWTKQITIAKNVHIRENIYDQIKKSGYDMTMSAKKLRDFYLKNYQF